MCFLSCLGSCPRSSTKGEEGDVELRRLWPKGELHPFSHDLELVAAKHHVPLHSVFGDAAEVFQPLFGLRFRHETEDRFFYYSMPVAFVASNIEVTSEIILFEERIFVEIISAQSVAIDVWIHMRSRTLTSRAHDELAGWLPAIQIVETLHGCEWSVSTITHYLPPR